ncbi:MAG: hypothetical protein BGO31_20195 [Bacteroidetes bacterium 43-16]|nr:MAG: hypothetical protein BGO31_20195 [Bacteroidetes bacterium 43-16]
MTETKEWFESWFDSPYHGMLYQRRDEHEASAFIDKLFAWLQPAAASSVLDIACGDGRHAAYMKNYVHEVIGIDLSEQRIQKAQKLAKENLAFYKQDMRNVFRLNYFDYAFNFFTSFGYFQHYRDNVIAADSFAKSLKPGGRLMIDYMNVDRVKDQLVAEEVVEVEGICFNIHRKSENGKIIKTIQFKDASGKPYSFEEVVSEFRLPDFKELFERCGLQLITTFGDYELNPFNVEVSPRLIMIFEKH